jgi:hypothetical protein
VIFNRVSTLYLVAAQAAINLVGAAYSLVTGTPLDATLLVALNGFAAAIIGLIANGQPQAAIARAPGE